jgi:hypothetical protein
MEEAMKKTRTLKNYRRLCRYYQYLQSKSNLIAYLWANNHLEDILLCVWENNIPYTTNANIEQWDLQITLFGQKFFIDKEYYDYLYNDYHDIEDSYSYYTEEDWSNEDTVIRAMRQLYRHGIITEIIPKDYNNLDFQFIPFRRNNIKKYRIFKRNMRRMKKHAYYFKFEGDILHINICNTYITIRA